MVGQDPAESNGETALEELFYQTGRVRLLYFDALTRERTTVLIVALIAIVSFITGIANLSRETVTLHGPLAPVLPEAETIVQFGGVLVAFILGPIIFGLHRERRIAWYAAVAMLFVTGLIPLITLRTTEIPLLGLVILGLPLLWTNRTTWDQPIDLSPVQIAALSSIFGVLAYGSIGAYAIRDQFVQIETWTDAIYYVIVTIATVGYGDITPITQQAQWFSLSVILLGTGAFTAAIGTLLIPAIERRMAAAVGTMKGSRVGLMDDHLLILGYGEITEALLNLLDEDESVLVVTNDSDAVAELQNRNIVVLNAERTDIEILKQARIDSARAVVVATEDDARDALTVIAVKESRGDIPVIVAANDERHVSKFYQAGADEVITATQLVAEFLDDVLNNIATKDE